MLRSYSLEHNKTKELYPLLIAYREVLDSIIEDIWDSITWMQKPIKGKKQKRLLPYIPKDNKFKLALRNKHLQNWEYANHWVDSALKTAFSIMRSWRKNYIRGERSRTRPSPRRLFIRVKQTLCKLEGDKLRITLKPREFTYIDLSKRYFKLPRTASSIGEPIITLDRVHLPIHFEEEREVLADRVAWDSNMSSIDGFSPKLGWIKIDTKPLSTVHISSFEKKRRIQRKASNSKKLRRVFLKYSRRERNRARRHQLEIARVVWSISEFNGFELLRKRRMFRASGIWDRMIARTDWRGIVKKVKEKRGVIELDPYSTSITCSRCGWVGQRPKGSTFDCEACGLRIDRQLNAAINLYLKMEGVPHQKEWWDEYVLPALMGGYVLTGAKQKAPNELVRELYDVVKPQLYYAYDRYADGYLPVPR